MSLFLLILNSDMKIHTGTIFLKIFRIQSFFGIQNFLDVVGIQVDKLYFVENIEIIREWSKDDVYKNKCESGLKYTKEKINFDEESEKIKNWINKL